MVFIADPSRFPDDEQYHTISIEEEDDGSFFIAASNNDVHCIATVDSIALGNEAVGLRTGSLLLDQAGKTMNVTYNPLHEHDYDEMKITFEDRE